MLHKYVSLYGLLSSPLRMCCSYLVFLLVMVFFLQDIVQEIQLLCYERIVCGSWKHDTITAKSTMLPIQESKSKMCVTKSTVQLLLSALLHILLVEQEVMGDDLLSSRICSVC